jgi:hypothetical protein
MKFSGYVDQGTEGEVGVSLEPLDVVVYDLEIKL